MTRIVGVKSCVNLPSSCQKCDVPGPWGDGICKSQPEHGMHAEFMDAFFSVFLLSSLVILLSLILLSQLMVFFTLRYCFFCFVVWSSLLLQRWGHSTTIILTTHEFVIVTRQVPHHIGNRCYIRPSRARVHLLPGSVEKKKYVNRHGSSCNLSRCAHGMRRKYHIVSPQFQLWWRGMTTWNDSEAYDQQSLYRKHLILRLCRYNAEAGHFRCNSFQEVCTGYETTRNACDFLQGTALYKVLDGLSQSPMIIGCPVCVCFVDPHTQTHTHTHTHTHTCASIHIHSASLSLTHACTHNIHTVQFTYKVL